eukprot:2757696-Rhodomonas_salina.1
MTFCISCGQRVRYKLGSAISSCRACDQLYTRLKAQGPVSQAPLTLDIAWIPLYTGSWDRAAGYLGSRLMGSGGSGYQGSRLMEYGFGVLVLAGKLLVERPARGCAGEDGDLFEGDGEGDEEDKARGPNACDARRAEDDVRRREASRG